LCPALQYQHPGQKERKLRHKGKLIRKAIKINLYSNSMKGGDRFSLHMHQALSYPTPEGKEKGVLSK
jgi:hypothetical protein